MKGLDGSKLRSRVKGRAAIEKSLHQLHRRAFRLATLRDLSAADYAWALDLCSALQVLLNPRPAGNPARPNNHGPENQVAIETAAGNPAPAWNSEKQAEARFFSKGKPDA